VSLLCPQATLALKETKEVIKLTQYTVKEKQSRSQINRDTSTKVNPRLTKTGNNNTKTWGQGYKSKQGLEIKIIEETHKPMKYNVEEDQSL